MPPHLPSFKRTVTVSVRSNTYICRSCQSKLRLSSIAHGGTQWRRDAFYGGALLPRGGETSRAIRSTRGSILSGLESQTIRRHVSDHTRLVGERVGNLRCRASSLLYSTRRSLRDGLLGHDELSVRLHSARFQYSSVPSVRSYHVFRGSHVAGSENVTGFHGKRYVSTAPAAGSVHAQKTIPYNAGELHTALAALEQDAGLFVDISQLRLVLRGLESDNAVTRVAVLGVEDEAGARRLARVLLADPLSKEAEWEKSLLEEGEGDGRALLLRYGKHANIDNRHPLVRTIEIPSLTLKNHQLEIFVQSVSSEQYTTGDGAASLLVPGLDTAVASSSGVRSSTVTYPVHKTLVYSNSFKYIASLAQLTRKPQIEDQEQLTKGLLDGAWNSLPPPASEPSLVSPVNLSLAETAIERFRDSLSQSFSYEHAWYDSGLPSVSDWLTSGTTKTTTIKPTITRLIQTILSTTTDSIASSETTAEQEAAAKTVPNTVRATLNSNISTWSQHSHFELQQRLDAAFLSKSWKRLKWYKLPFRADDIPSTLSSLLSKAWLPDSERELIHLSGRLQQAGLLPEPSTKEWPPSLYTILHMTPPEEMQTEDGNAPIKELGTPKRDFTVRDVMLDDLVAPAFDTPSPLLSSKSLSPTSTPLTTLISTARASFAAASIPHLHSLAQTLVLETLSTTILSTGIAALVYVGISTTSLFEAGTIVAVGVVWAARRLQRGWEAARREWVSELRAEGVRAIEGVEGDLREVVEKGGVGEVGERERREWEVARRAVERVGRALEEVEERVGREGS